MLDEQEPEAVLSAFFMANLRPDEATVRELILDHPDLHELIQGNYPDDVAALLAAQYATMEYVRVEESPDRVLIRSSASPIPIAVVKVGDRWRVDANPIIEFRKRARRLGESNQE